MAADDYGVMRASEVTLQAANTALAKQSKRKVLVAMDTLVEVRLLTAFEHQGERYLCQLDWQDFQKIRYPRDTHQPVPPAEILSKCSTTTAELFSQRFRKKTETDRELQRAPAREEANGLRLTAEANASGSARLQPSQPARTPETVCAGSLPRDHVAHAVCDDRFSWCVPMAVHDHLAQQLAPKYGGDRQAAKSALKAWYPTIWSTLAPDFVMGDAFKFWRPHFDGAFVKRTDVSRPDPQRQYVPSVEESKARREAIFGKSAAS